MLHVVLFQPEIPQNTGNIARTCAATGSILHLVEPLGFSLDSRYLKRAGLDYWPLASVYVHPSFSDVRSVLSSVPFFYTSSHAGICYSEMSYPGDSAVVFGPESCGLPEDLIRGNENRCVRIPMISAARSLNLANSVAVLVYEIARQHHFEGLEKRGSSRHSDCGVEWKDYL